jgi:hypothetical protein
MRGPRARAVIDEMRDVPPEIVERTFAYQWAGKDDAVADLRAALRDEVERIVKQVPLVGGLFR